MVELGIDSKGEYEEYGSATTATDASDEILPDATTHLLTESSKGDSTRASGAASEETGDYTNAEISKFELEHVGDALCPSNFIVNLGYLKINIREVSKGDEDLEEIPAHVLQTWCIPGEYAERVITLIVARPSIFSPLFVLCRTGDQMEFLVDANDFINAFTDASSVKYEYAGGIPPVAYGDHWWRRKRISFLCGTFVCCAILVGCGLGVWMYFAGWLDTLFQQHQLEDVPILQSLGRNDSNVNAYYYFYKRQEMLDCVCEDAQTNHQAAAEMKRTNCGYGMDGVVLCKSGKHEVFDEFETCAMNDTCARNCILNFMISYAGKCVSGTPRTEDMVRVHAGGPDACKGRAKSSTDEYWTEISNCMRRDFVDAYPDAVAMRHNRTVDPDQVSTIRKCELVSLFDSRQLKLGSQGVCVEIVQSAVGVPIDGKFDRNTQQAVMRYQAQHGLIPTGMVGRTTWREIKTDKGIADYTKNFMA